MTTTYTGLCKLPRVDLVTASPLPIPLNVYVEMTNVCQFACKCCPESLPEFFAEQGGKHRLRVHDWDSVAGKISALTRKRPVLKSLHFYMLGEPLLNTATTEYIRDAVDRRLSEKTILTTNGLLVGKYAKQIADSGLTYLRVSLYEEYRQHWPTIRDGLEMLRAVRTDGPFIYVKSFVEDGTIRQTFEGVADELDVVDTMNWNETQRVKLGDSHRGDKKACPMPFYTLVIHANLEVSACCVDWNRKVKVGDLRQQTLAQVWNSDAMHRLRLAHLEGRKHEVPGCRDCTIQHTLPDNVDGLTADEYRKRMEA